MCGSAPPAPKVQPLPPEPAPKAKQSSEQVKMAKRQQETQQRNLKGSASTNLTGPQGLMAPVNTGTSILLGTV
jgi:hypothetical protein